MTKLSYQCDRCDAEMMCHEKNPDSFTPHAAVFVVHTCPCVLNRITELEDQLMREQTNGWRGTK